MSTVFWSRASCCPVPHGRTMRSNGSSPTPAAFRRSRCRCSRRPRRRRDQRGINPPRAQRTAEPAAAACLTPPERGGGPRVALFLAPAGVPKQLQQVSAPVTRLSRRAALLGPRIQSEATMSDIAATLPPSVHAPAHTPVGKPKLDHPTNPLAAILFFGFLAAGILYMAYSVYADVENSGMRATTYLPFVLLFVALLIALGFEFVSGFHDTANAVATVIYTHSMPAPVAVVWAGVFNFLGVVISSGAVAFGIISLLPVELILQVGSSAGFAMVFALLFAAIIWNLGTWYLGLPASSSHTLIGSIIGVGVANALMHGQDGTTGVDWTKATEIGYSLLLSPLFGFFAAALLLLVLKLVVRNPALYREPKGNQPPPWWIRGTLIATCTGVSF